ncbi:MAG: acyltransferase [Myxococcota bacterium]|nr:acyltransferase [Myxococcota bacterium]
MKLPSLRDAVLGRMRGRTRIRDRGARNHVDVHATARLRGVTLDLGGDDIEIVVGGASRLRNVRIVCEGDGLRVSIGERVKVRVGAELVLRDRGSSIEIGDGVSIESARVVSLEGRGVSIGAGSMLAYDIEIRNSDSHSILDASTGARLNPPADVVLDEHVWVGARCSVLKGTRVGRDSILGMGSVVSGQFPEGVVVAGCPATVRRTGVTWTQERTS